MKKIVPTLLVLLMLCGAAVADQAWFRPEMIREVVWAELDCGSVSLTCTDPAALQALTELLTHVQDTGGMTAGCPFTVSLKVERADGQQIRLQLATDSCCVYRVDGRDYQYARHLWNEEEGSPDNAALFSLFGVDPQENNLHAALPVNAYCFTDVPLYRNPGDAEAFAVLPKLTQVWWRSATEDRALGYVVAALNGERVQGYAPWDNLQTFNDGTESTRAMAALIAHMGWSQAEVAAYQLYTPVMKQQNQFSCVTVRSKTEPQWWFHVWLDQLTGGVHSITWD